MGDTVKSLVTKKQFSIRLAFSHVEISKNGYRYIPKLTSETEVIADTLLRLTGGNE
jgi:hypothetical protein